MVMEHCCDELAISGEVYRLGLFIVLLVKHPQLTVCRESLEPFGFHDAMTVVNISMGMERFNIPRQPSQSINSGLSRLGSRRAVWCSSMVTSGQAACA